jgi:parallel beta-helix repeat protein
MLVTAGFIGLLVFEGVVDEGSVIGITTRYVGGTGPGNYSKIQDAIDNASTGDTIYVWAGTYYENVIVNKTLTLIGNGTGNTIINGSDTGDVVHVTADDVEIRGFTIIESGSVYSSNTYDVGIELDHVKDARITDNNCSDNACGIYLNYSNSNIVKKNLCLDNSVGMYLRWSDSNTISNNICNKNNGGIDLFWSDYNKISNNTFNSNLLDGCYLDFSERNTLYDNTFTLNGFSGTTMWDSNWNHIDKNIISNNGQGLWFYNSENNTFENNTCNSNFQVGMFSDQCDSNIFISNNFSFNRDGVVLYLSNINFFENNNISSNDIGINFTWGMNDNVFSKNNISFNTKIGILISFNCNNNQFYHNNIISNTQQLAVLGSQIWHHNNEGNYWSDYAGSDDGTGDRTAGDGIGDTNIPHLGVDDYPFVKLSGWLFPGTPQLKIESAVDSDGNYSVSWWNNPKATGYVLEEDITETFDSPTEYNQGWEIELDRMVFQAENKPENTYYYRLKANKDISESDWSEVVKVTVDYLPRIPQNFKVSVYPTGNALNLSWDLNLEDTTNYEVNYKTMTDPDWKLLENVLHPSHKYNQSGLVNGERYYYWIRSMDARGQWSAFSDIINAVPMDSIPPAAPTGLEATAISDHEVLLTWEANTDDDLAGYILFMNNTNSGPTDKFHIIDTLSDQKTSYTVSGLMEQVTYHFKLKAFDEVPNNSSFSAVASATPPDETHPRPPTGLVISNATNNSLTISWTANTESDVVGYIIFSSKSLSGSYENITQDLIKETQYIDTGLEEATIYYYKVSAVDDVGQESLISDAAFGITLIGPKPPVINNTIENVELREDKSDDLAINLYYLFKDPNDDLMTFRCEGEKQIQVTIFQENGRVVLVPVKDWNGKEILTFYANDGVFEVSTQISITVIVTPVNDPPRWAKIITPEDNLAITGGTTLDFNGESYDPDLLYGEKLSFKWTSSIDKVLGTGQNLTVASLSTGEHVITFEVTDNTGKKASATINVTVIEKAGTAKTDAGDNIGVVLGVVGIIIIIICVLLILLFMGKKKLTPETKDEDLLQSETEGVHYVSGTNKGNHAQPLTQQTQSTTPIPIAQGPYYTPPSPQPVSILTPGQLNIWPPPNLPQPQLLPQQQLPPQKQPSQQQSPSPKPEHEQPHEPQQ